jgi:hypothetical protein
MHASEWTSARIAADERPATLPVTVTTPGGRDLVLASTATPTQVANPNRTTLRSVVQLLVAFGLAAPEIVAIVLGYWDPQWLALAGAQIIAVHGAVTRIMAIPGVNAWITEHLAGLAAIPVETIRVRE